MHDTISSLQSPLQSFVELYDLSFYAWLAMVAKPEPIHLTWAWALKQSNFSITSSRSLIPDDSEWIALMHQEIV